METQRKITLRPIEKSDLDSIFKWRNNRLVTKHLACPETTRKKIDDWFNSLGADRRAYAIDVDDVFVGYASIDNIDDMNKKCEIGIVIGEKLYWSKGIGKEVARRITRIAFQELKMHRVLAVSSERNVLSTKCFKSAGFREEGRLRDANLRDGKFFDLILLSILKHEWKSNNSLN